jgi:hypothetical protein
MSQGNNQVSDCQIPCFTHLDEWIIAGLADESERNVSIVIGAENFGLDRIPVRKNHIDRFPVADDMRRGQDQSIGCDDHAAARRQSASVSVGYRNDTWSSLHNERLHLGLNPFERVEIVTASRDLQGQEQDREQPADSGREGSHRTLIQGPGGHRVAEFPFVERPNL